MRFFWSQRNLNRFIDSVAGLVMLTCTTTDRNEDQTQAVAHLKKEAKEPGRLSSYIQTVLEQSRKSQSRDSLTDQSLSKLEAARSENASDCVRVSKMKLQ